MNDRPQLGIALAGGGSKASSFAMGVIEGLSESGILQSADYLSTVSGGGYAAYFYYGQTINRISSGQSVNFDHDPEFYRDCIPNFSSEERVNWQALALDIDHKPFCNESGVVLYDHGKNEVLNPYQGHIRGHVDVFSSRFNLESTNEREDYVRDVAWQAGFAALEWPAYATTELLFDWNAVEAAPRRIYREGIVRTYAATPFDCAQDISLCRDDGRPQPDTEVIEQHTFENQLAVLRRAEVDCAGREHCGMPYWLINGTTEVTEDIVGNSRRQPFSEPFELAVIEMTPHGIMSRQFGEENDRYLMNATPDWFQIPQAVGASAAFFDSQQRQKGQNELIRRALGGSLRFASLEWGYDIPNPKQSQFQRAFHKVLPWPFYRFHAFERGPKAVDVHISDGGQRENLGLWPLIRRGVRQIVVSDHSQDRSGTMEDLCTVNLELQNEDRLSERLVIHMPSLEHFQSLCNELLQDDDVGLSQFWRGDYGSQYERVAYNKGYAIHHWKNPITLGCITPLNLVIESVEDCNNAYELNPAVSKLFVIKPAIKFDQRFEDGVEACNDAIKKGTFSANNNSAGHEAKDKSNRMQRSVAARKQWGLDCQSFIEEGLYPNADNKLQKPISLEFIKTTFDNFCGGKHNGYHEKDRHLVFPQHSTTAMTANSSYTLYGAYRELGYALASELTMGPDRTINYGRPNQLQELQEIVNHDNLVESLKRRLLGSGESYVAVTDETLTEKSRFHKPNTRDEVCS